MVPQGSVKHSQGFCIFSNFVTLVEIGSVTENVKIETSKLMSLNNVFLGLFGK